MKPNLFPILFLIVIIFQTACSVQNKPGERETDFNPNWKFIRADVPGAEQVDFDDSAWRMLDLPHDYSIEDLPEKEGVKQIGPFSEESEGGPSTGNMLGGTAWYRKHFVLNKEDEGKIIKVLFDGVYMNCDVWINGNHLGNHPYGYTAFAFDLTQYLHPNGEDNILAVQVKNEGKNSRWYSGSGIYRNVTLLKTNPISISLWGNYITTPEVSENEAKVSIETNVANLSYSNDEIVVSVEISDLSTVVATSETKLSLNPEGKNIANQELQISNPQLWGIENPYLYTANIRVIRNGKTLDEKTQKFGIRSIEFSTENGFLLNGENVLLKGGCLHHDNGFLGSATFKTAEYRRVKIMKENGFNAIRTAHNPPSELFLDACDELGMLVMDESFDQWQLPKNPQDYNLYFNEWWEKDLESMLMRDRNHPSIIIWSVGNEIRERADSSGLEIFRNLKDKVLELDQTRPVTQAICFFWEQPEKTWDYSAPAFALMDVHSYNYQWNNYERDHQKFPERIIVGTESFPKEAYENWELVEKNSYIVGDFVWTGMDHLGESGIGNSKLDNDPAVFLPPWPWFVNYSGDISLLGFKKPQMYFRDVVWRNSDLEILVHAPVPEGRKEVISMWGWPNEWKSWNWEGSEGKLLQVSVYSRCDEVRLELNGKVIGTQKNSYEMSSSPQQENPRQSIKSSALTAQFDVPYQAGELVAVGLKEGIEIARQSLKTTGKPAELRITAENEKVEIGQNDLAYFNVEVLDENGLLIPNAEIPVEFNIQGNCKLQAVGNENPTDMNSFQQPRVNTFRGRCQIILRLNNESGEIAVSANANGLISGEAKVLVQ